MKRKIGRPEFETPMEGLETLYEEFKASRYEELQFLKDALLKLDFKSLLKMSHKWKGFCDPYGFGELTILSGEVEQYAEEENSVACAKVLSEIEEYLGTK